MDFGGLLFLGLIWLLFSLLNRSRDEGAGSKPRPRPPGSLPSSGPAGRPGSRDATQREGSRLEQLLREMERALEQSQPGARGRLERTPGGGSEAGPRGRPAKVPLPAAEEVEERETLEEQPLVVSLETDVRRPRRVVVDQDDLAEEVVRRRIAAAEARGGALTRADHRAFDERIRQEPADQTAVRGYTAAQLRDAIVWREILGPPAALRQDDLG